MVSCKSEYISGKCILLPAEILRSGFVDVKAYNLFLMVCDKLAYVAAPGRLGV